MKQYQLHICILFVCISGTFLIPCKSYGQLKGSYTINPTKAASNINYRNWASAVSDLQTGSRSDGGSPQGAGVKGAVTFTVYDSIYANTQIAIGAISGASYSNTITFKSLKGDSSKCVLQYPSSNSSTDDYAVLLDGADYITFKQIGMERTGSNTYSTVIQITNDADNNKFIRCQMKAFKMPSNTTLGFAYGIGSCIYFTGNGDSTEITQNRLLYGYNGIFSTTASTANKISGNTIDTSGSSGIYMTNQTSLKITGNTISMGDFGANLGHYTSYGMRIETSPSLEISKNKIYMLAVNGQVTRAIILSGIVSTASQPGMVYNNFIMASGGTGNCTGLAAYTCDYINFYFNNVLITNTLSDGAAFFHNPSFISTYIKLMNNNLINKGGGYACSVSGANTSDLDTVNFNNIYTSGTNLGIWNASNITSISSWQSSTGKDANSINLDPGYTNNNNLHVSNYGLKAKGFAIYNIKDDIDGELRNINTPDIGADELKPIYNDAGIVALTKPLAGQCVGPLSVQAVIQNFGAGKLIKATINWSINGIYQTPYNWTGNLNKNGKDTVVIGNYNFTATLNPKFVIKSSLPNGKTDTLMFNDSIIVVRSLRALPSISLGPDFSICLGDSIQIGSVNNPTLSYKWLTITGSAFATTSQIFVKPTIKTSYILEATNKNFGCINRDTLVISVNNKPVADAGPDHTICPGSSAQLGATPQSGFVYYWTSQPVRFKSTIANPLDTPSVTTTYSLTKVVTATGCQATDIAVVTVISLPTPFVTGIISACNNDRMNYITTSNGGNTYKWYVTGGQLLSGQNTNAINVRWNTPGTGNLKVIETNSATCKDSSMLAVTVNTSPKANFSVIGLTCKGSATVFKDMSNDAQSYQWTFGDAGTSTLASPTHLYATVNTFPVKLIVMNAADCPDTANLQVTINPLPVADFSTTKVAEKTYDFTDISTIPSGTISGWLWDFGDGSDSSTVKNPNHQYSLGGTFVIKLCVTSNAGCKACNSRSFNVLGLHSTELNNTLLAVPNPGSGIFTITSKVQISAIQVTNLLGQVIENTQPMSDDFKIDLSNQPAGIYFVKVTYGNSSGILKIIIQ